MATEQATMDEILSLLPGLPVRARKMFGEYGLYCDEKVVGFVCDDQLFIKITDAGVQYVQHPVYAQAYPGSKDYLLIDQDSWYQANYLPELITVTANALPVPAPKKPRKK